MNILPQFNAPKELRDYAPPVGGDRAIRYVTNTTFQFMRAAGWIDDQGVVLDAFRDESGYRDLDKVIDASTVIDPEQEPDAALRRFRELKALWNLEKIVGDGLLNDLLILANAFDDYQHRRENGDE